MVHSVLYSPEKRRFSMLLNTLCPPFLEFISSEVRVHLFCGPAAVTIDMENVIIEVQALALLRYTVYILWRTGSSDSSKLTHKLNPALHFTYI